MQDIVQGPVMSNVVYLGLLLYGPVIIALMSHKFGLQTKSRNLRSIEIFCELSSDTTGLRMHYNISLMDKVLKLEKLGNSELIICR
jgi:hypothetical protein